MGSQTEAHSYPPGNQLPNSWPRNCLLRIMAVYLASFSVTKTVPSTYCTDTVGCQVKASAFGLSVRGEVYGWKLVISANIIRITQFPWMSLIATGSCWNPWPPCLKAIETLSMIPICNHLFSWSLKLGAFFLINKNAVQLTWRVSL